MHGCRTSFRNWGADNKNYNFRREVLESGRSRFRKSMEGETIGYRKPVALQPGPSLPELSGKVDGRTGLGAGAERQQAAVRPFLDRQKKRLAAELPMEAFPERPKIEDGFRSDGLLPKPLAFIDARGDPDRQHSGSQTPPPPPVETDRALHAI
jgi:hypothetical protein